MTRAGISLLSSSHSPSTAGISIAQTSSGWVHMRNKDDKVQAKIVQIADSLPLSTTTDRLRGLGPRKKDQ